VLGAWIQALVGRPAAAERRGDAQAALAGLGPSSPWRTAIMVIEGAADVLEGRTDQADAILAHAVEVGTHAGALPAVSTALAERSLVGMRRHDWPAASTLATRRSEWWPLGGWRTTS
jgi:hypothetical protein